MARLCGERIDCSPVITGMNALRTTDLTADLAAAFPDTLPGFGRDVRAWPLGQNDADRLACIPLLARLLGFGAETEAAA